MKKKKDEILTRSLIGGFVCFIFALVPMVHMVAYHINGTTWHQISFLGGIAGIFIIVARLFTKHFDVVFGFEHELGKDVNLQYDEYMKGLADSERRIMQVYVIIVIVLVTFPFWLPFFVK